MPSNLKRLKQLYTNMDLTRNAKLVGAYIAVADKVNISIHELAEMCRLNVALTSNALFLLGVTGFITMDSKVRSAGDIITIRWIKDE